MDSELCKRRLAVSNGRLGRAGWYEPRHPFMISEWGTKGEIEQVSDAFALPRERAVDSVQLIGTQSVAWPDGSSWSMPPISPTESGMWDWTSALINAKSDVPSKRSSNGERVVTLRFNHGPLFTS